MTTEAPYFVNYKGKRIQVHDYKNLPAEDVPARVRAYTGAMEDSGETGLLVLIDGTGSFMDRESIAAFKIHGGELRPTSKRRPWWKQRRAALLSQIDLLRHRRQRRGVR